MRIKFTQAARRRHGIAPSRARYVIAHSLPQVSVTAKGNPSVLWIGDDADGNTLEVMAVIEGNGTVLVIHVMPHHWRKR